MATKNAQTELDAFTEANMLLTSTLEQLDDIITSGSRLPGPHRKSLSRRPIAATSVTYTQPLVPPHRSYVTPVANGNTNGLLHQSMICNGKSITINTNSKDIDEGLDMENGNSREDDPPPPSDREKETAWQHKDFGRLAYGSDGSSGVESPPSDMPTSSSSLGNPGKIYNDFIKALEENAIPERPDPETQLKIVQWLSGSTSPSPSMSTVSCPEYPELQEKLHRLAMARDSLQLQVCVLTEQISAQKEKIRDLETLLSLKRNSLTSTDELLQDKLRKINDEPSDYETRKMNLMAEVSSLKLKFATLEREKDETEQRLKHSQNEFDQVSQSMQGMNVAVQPLKNGKGSSNSMDIGNKSTVRSDKHEEEMSQLRAAVQRLIVDNEQKSIQINNLRTALDEQIKIKDMQSRTDNYYSSSPRWSGDSSNFDVAGQIKRILMDDPLEPMSHSTSFPVSLCSSGGGGALRTTTPRNVVQPSSSYTSSLSAASPQHSWSQNNTPRHLHPATTNLRNDLPSYRSPSSPAARQLAAELDELRRIGVDGQGHSYSTASLPRGLGKANSTFTLPKKLSVTSNASAGELSAATARPPPRSAESECGEATASRSSDRSRGRGYRLPLNRWIGERMRKAKRTRSEPNIGDALSESEKIESDDEVARGRSSTNLSQASSQGPKAFKRDRTRSSLRNLFSKLTRSTSQDQHAFRRGSAARSTSSGRLGMSTSILPGAIAIRPPLSQFVDWRTEQLAEWMAEVGFPEYVPEVSKHARSGRHLLNMSNHEYESILGIKNPLHRKRLSQLLRRIEDDITEPCNNWDIHLTLRWLEDIGLPQYKETFTENHIDGAMLIALTAADMAEMKIYNGHHYLTISRSIQLLKMCDFKPGLMDRKYDTETINRCPCPENVVRWTHTVVCEWLRHIDLAEFTPNMLCAGVPGCLMVYEPTFTAESLAEILQIPAHKTLLRRHLTSHYNQLLGQKIIAEKRDFLASGIWPTLGPSVRIKLVKKGFSLPKKKSRNEICFEPEELLCPQVLNHKYPQNGDTSSVESSNV